MAKTVRILGSGLSGLSAAINLSKNGFQPEVLEKNSDAGLQIQPNFQAFQARECTPADYLKGLNLCPKFRQLVFMKALFSTSGRDLELNLRQPVYFIQRGGERSLEAGLKKQAEDAGVKISFNAKIQEKDADIIASGPRRVDAAAY
ncbi:MAG: NAD(P)-binding protein, partial [Candidatus Altiarchaeota archaeon]|nr:NAD(P)-binding protein [Candidatus Altiarchaeota archaeon]